MDWTKLIESLLSGTVIAAVATTMLNLFTKSKTEKITADIQLQTEQLSSILKTQYTWKEKSLSEVLGPINMHLNRTEKAFKRLIKEGKPNPYMDTKIFKESHEQIRDILLQKGYLIPIELIPDASELVEHYDKWLEEYEKVRLDADLKNLSKFVFAGPQGYPFPKHSAQTFQEKYNTMWNEFLSDQN